jgi:hypothetical protein
MCPFTPCDSHLIKIHVFIDDLEIALYIPTRHIIVLIIITIITTITCINGIQSIDVILCNTMVLNFFENAVRVFLLIHKMINDSLNPIKLNKKFDRKKKIKKLENLNNFDS